MTGKNEVVAKSGPDPSEVHVMGSGGKKGKLKRASKRMKYSEDCVEKSAPVFIEMPQ